MCSFPWRSAAAGLVLALLAACGGGGAGSTSADEPRALPAAAPVTGADITTTATSTATPSVETRAAPATPAEAARFLTQASFGPTDPDIARVMAIGYAAWIDEQFAKAPTSHRAHWEARHRALTAAGVTHGAGQDQFLESFWKGAVTGDDQLRQRLAYALSQIFVVSMVDTNVGNAPRSVSAWLDMLNQQGTGNYRQLLESVARHPIMGVYLSHLRNQKADVATGRVPDENFARELMQLFSIGLVELEEDGTPRMSSRGAALDTYGPADVSGLAQVFTGFSFACPGWPSDACFLTGTHGGVGDPDRDWKPMVGYPQFHQMDGQPFLGTAVPPQSPAAPETSLRVALDAIAAHPNVGPFIGRQLIQRFVTSNPSPAYVRAVARTWADNGAGVRGDLRAVMKAVLLHPEARVIADTSGKLREPVLRLSAYLRAFPHRSDTGLWRIGQTDNPGTALGQTPLRAPSVFNFYRPGHVAPGTRSAERKLVAPELQITSETSVAGYINFMRDGIANGLGAVNTSVDGRVLNRPDVQPDFSAELALATDAPALVARVASRLTWGQLGAAALADIAAAVASIAIPTLNTSGSNQAQIDGAKRQRVNAAVLLVLATPECQVQT